MRESSTLIFGTLGRKRLGRSRDVVGLFAIRSTLSPTFSQTIGQFESANALSHPSIFDAFSPFFFSFRNDI